MNRHETLKHLMQSGQPLRLPGAYDVLSAKLIEQAGFPVVYIGSYGTAASAFGWPDVGLLELNDLTELAGKVVRAVKVPVIADAENGFHEPANLWKTVSAFEAAGVSAIHIEDHAGGKHTDRPQHLIPLELMLVKLRAALDARQDPHFQIIARTDAIWATHDVAEAVRRCQAFAALGVDMVFPTGADADTVQSIRALLGPRTPIVGIETQNDAPRTREGRPDIVLNYGFALFAVTRTLQQALITYRHAQTPQALVPMLTPVLEFEALFDYAGFSARASRYDVVPPTQDPCST